MTVATQVQTIDWPGASGKRYKHWIYDLPPNFKAVAGNYIFAKRNSQGRWVPVYIGQTENLSERFDDHHAMHCIKLNGATHIHAHANGSKSDRLAEESDLLDNFDTTCNRT